MATVQVAAAEQMDAAVAEQVGIKFDELAQAVCNAEPIKDERH